MKVLITKKQFNVIKESVDQEVEDFFSAEKGRFYLFGPIPTNRTTGSEAIKRILKSENKRFEFGENVDLNELSIVNRLRFGVYLKELLKEKTTRGNNFEGFMSGLFDGYLPKDTNYWFDFRIRNGTVEQKFRENLKDSPQLKTYAKFIEKHPEYSDLLKQSNTPEIIEQKLKMLNEPEFLTDFYVFSYEIDNGPNQGYRIDNYVITKDEMIQILLNPKNIVKSQQKGQTALRISYTVLGNVDFTITTPRYSATELKDLIKLSEKEKAVWTAFGKHGDHIRPDVIKDITKDLPKFIELLINAEENYE